MVYMHFPFLKVISSLSPQDVYSWLMDYISSFRRSEATNEDVLYKNLLLKNLQNSLENTSVGVSFNKVAVLQACNFIKKRL